jgi:ferritin-like metal-binding protein YciE
MKPLKLEVIFGAVNNLSPALKIIIGSSKAANDALKRTRDQIKALNDQQKQIDGFKRLKQQTVESGQALKDMQNKIKSMRQAMGSNPTAEMVRDFDKAKAAAKRLKDAHNQNIQELHRMRSEMQAAGVNTNNLASHQQQLRQRLSAATEEYNRQRQAIRNLHDTQQRYQQNSQRVKNAAMTGMVMAGTGVAAMYQLRKPVDETKRVDVEQARIASLGLGEAATKDAIKYAEAIKTFGTSTLDNLMLVRDATTAFADIKHAKMVTPLLARMKFSNEALYGEEQGANNERKFMDMLKVVELKGGLKSEAEFKQQADYIQQIITATGGRVQPEHYLQLIKRAKLSAMGMTNEAFYYTLEPLIQMTSGNEVGVALMSAYQNLHQGRTTKRAVNNLRELGLISDEKKVRDDKAGQNSYLNVGALKGSDLFLKDPFQWMETVLLPQLASKGITEKQDVLNAIGSIYSNRNAAGLFGMMYDQRENIHKNINLNKGADDIDKLFAKAQDTTSGKELEARAKLHDAYLEFGKTILPMYTSAIIIATDALKGFTGWMQSNPKLAKLLGVGLLSIAIGLVAIGGALVVFSPLILAMLSFRLMMATVGTQGGILARVFSLFPNVLGGVAKAFNGVRAFGLGNALRFIGFQVLSLSRLLVATPIGWAVGLIAVAALLIYKYWGPISAFFKGVWAGIGQGLAPVRESLGTLFSTIGDALAPLKPVWDGFLNILGTIGGAIGSLFSPFNATTEQLKGATDAGQSFGKLIGLVVGAPIQLLIKAFQLVGTAIGNTVGWFVTLPEKISSGWQTITGFFSGIWAGITGAFDTGVGYIKNIIQSVDDVFANNPIMNILLPFIGIPRLIIANWGSITGWFSQVWSVVKQVFSAGIDAIKSFLLNWTLPGLVYKNWDGISGWFSNKWSQTKQAFSAGVDATKSFLLNWTPVGYVYNNWDGITGWFSNKWDQTKQAFSAGVDGTKYILLNWTAPGLIYKNWDGISSWFGSKWEQIKAFFNSGIGNISKTIIDWSPVGLFYQAFANVLSWFGIELPAKFTGFGSMIIDGLVSGIEKGFDKLKVVWNKVNSYMPDFMQKKMDIHSPSRVFMGIGHYIMEGLGLGIDKNNSPLAALKGKVKGMLAAGALALSMSANAAPDQQQTITQRLINTVIQPVANQEQTITQRVDGIDVPGVANQQQSIYQRLVSAVIPPAGDQQQSIIQRVINAVIPPVGSQEQTITQRLASVLIPAVGGQSQSIVQRLIRAFITPVGDQQQTVFQHVVKAIIPPAGDQQQTIRQRLVKAFLTPLGEQQLTVMQHLVTAVIPPLGDQQQTISQRLIKASITPVGDQQQSIMQRLVGAVVQPVANQQQTITQRLISANIPKPASQEQTITQRVASADIPAPVDQQQVITQVIKPAIFSLPKMFQSMLKLIVDNSFVKDLPTHVMAGLGYDTSGVLDAAKRIQLPDVKESLAKIENPAPLAAAPTAKTITVQGDTINIHIHAQPGQSAQDIARAVQQELDKRERAKAARKRDSFRDQD